MPSIGRLLDSALAVATTAASVSIAVMLFNGGTLGSGVGGPARSVSAGENIESAQLRIESASVLRDRATKGDIAFIEVSDVQCPFCAQFARESMARVRQDFVDAGKVSYGFLHFPLEEIHPRALRGGVALECADEKGAFWRLHEHLFGNQKALGEEDLVEAASAVGLEEEAFRECMTDPRMTEVVKNHQALGTRIGVAGTPTTLIGRLEKDGKILLLRRLRGVQTYDSLERALADVGAGG